LISAHNPRAHFCIAYLRSHVRKTNGANEMSDPNFVPFEPSYTIDEFCQAERVSRVSLYEMWKLGKGPRYYYNGRCRRITHRARLDWQTAKEAEACAQRAA
jgi:hypothetical protein